MSGLYRVQYWGMVALIFIMQLPGCAVINEGAINYHKGVTRSGASAGKKLELVKKYNLTGETQQNTFTKSTGSGTGDAISIHLVQGFIKNFPEVANIFKGEGKKTARGEIAVVVKAFELKEGNSLSFDANAADSGRLVYYSDDVRQDQYLNFSYLPVYGPVKWEGYPIGLQIYVIDIDSGDEQLKPLLHTLAGLGSMLYAPAAPVLTVLDKLGTALLNGSHDDIIFRYYMTFYPSDGVKDLGYPILEPANYVLMRQENRLGDFDWKAVQLDREDGRLRVGQGADAPLFRDETYLVFQVQKGFQFNAGSWESSLYKTFRDSIGKSASSQGASVASALDEAANEIANTSAYKELEMLSNKIVNCVSTDLVYKKMLVQKFVYKLAAAIQRKDSCGKTPKKYGCLTQDQIDPFIGVLQTIDPNDGITSKMIVASPESVVKKVVAKM